MSRRLTPGSKDHEASLPVEDIRDAVMDRVHVGPVVITAPTGSGKSTQVPRWMASLGRVLVIEPRRVACRGLAARVASLENTPLGIGVGYVVREDNRSSRDTGIVFATPGVVLRWMADGHLPLFETVVIDEFHERSLDVDLLLAVLRLRHKGFLVVMSATLDAVRLAENLGANHVHCEGRAFAVEAVYRPADAFAPEVRGLEDRVCSAIRELSDDPGDVLVFLPGKGEISRCRKALRSRAFTWTTGISPTWVIHRLR